MKQVQQIAPNFGPHHVRISDFHSPVADNEFDQEVRAGYAKRTPLILRYAAKGSGVGVNFMHFSYKPNADAAWGIICGEGIRLYPYYPFLHFFLSFACPWRKLAVLIEESETPWKEEEVEAQNELLSLSGWRVFRVPAEVSGCELQDLLPENIWQAWISQDWDPEEKEAYEALLPHLQLSSIDGFFAWLKQEHFSSEALVRYQLAANEAEISGTVEQGTVYHTTDYGRFKLLEENRPLDTAHVNKLVHAIKYQNLLDQKPIDVTADFEVIDGQHRLEAARTLNTPIYFRVLTEKHTLPEQETEELIGSRQAQPQQQFEQWAQRQGLYLDKNAEGAYTDIFVQAKWQGWQAALLG